MNRRILAFAAVVVLLVTAGCTGNNDPNGHAEYTLTNASGPHHVTVVQNSADVIGFTSNKTVCEYTVSGPVRPYVTHAEFVSLSDGVLSRNQTETVVKWFSIGETTPVLDWENAGNRTVFRIDLAHSAAGTYNMNLSHCDESTSTVRFTVDYADRVENKGDAA